MKAIFLYNTGKKTEGFDLSKKVKKKNNINKKYLKKNKGNIFKL
jgi:hypothetical protein